MLYTPVEKATGKRLALHVDPAEVRTKPCTVTNQKDGRRYRITAKSCGLRCKCDAWAEEITA